MLFPRLTRDGHTQQFPNLFLKSATMRCSMLLNACMQGHVNIANQQAGPGGIPQPGGVRWQSDLDEASFARLQGGARLTS